MNDISVPKDLEVQVQTIRAFATLYNLIGRGFFNAPNFDVVKESLSFIQGIHSEAIKKAAEHESAKLVPELAEYLQKKAEADGTTKEG